MNRCPKAGDRVRFSAWGIVNSMEGIVLRVIPMARPVGGARHRVRVKWENGSVSTHDDRVLEVLA